MVMMTNSVSPAFHSQAQPFDPQSEGNFPLYVERVVDLVRVKLLPSLECSTPPRGGIQPCYELLLKFWLCREFFSLSRRLQKIVSRRLIIRVSAVDQIYLSAVIH